MSDAVDSKVKTGPTLEARLQAWTASVILILVLITNLIKALVEVSTQLREIPILKHFAESPWIHIALFSCVSLLVASGLLLRAYSQYSELINPERLILDPNRADHLFGRNSDVELLMDHCRREQLVYMVGESGVGKSSMIRAGLIPRLSIAPGFPTLLPIYLDTYGPDWETGPLEIACQTLWMSLTEAERKLVGLEKPPTDRIQLEATITTIIGSIQRTPLLIFDQFDDYQFQHLAKFLPGRSRTWLSTSSLIVQNRFWAMVGELIRTGSVHVVIVTRKDAADGLGSVHFTEPAVFSLTAIRKEDLESGIKLITESPPSPILNPDAGWIRLRQRIVKDLADTSGIVPARLSQALKGLARLPRRRLTVSAYEAVGGLSGLEAAEINWHSQHTALSENDVKEMLVEFIDPSTISDGTVTTPKTRWLTLNDLNEYQGPNSAANARFTQAIEYLISRKILRARIDRTRKQIYSLHHDYLCSGVLAALRQSQTWISDFHEAEQSHEESERLSWKWWTTLLSPRQILELSKHILLDSRRRNVLRPYFFTSLIRLIPMLALIGMATYGGIEASKYFKAVTVVRRIFNAEPAKVQLLATELSGVRHWSDPILRQEYTSAFNGSAQKLKASLALLPADEAQYEYLFKQALEANPEDLLVIRTALRNRSALLAPRLWTVVAEDKDEQHRFRAACVLVELDPDAKLAAKPVGGQYSEVVGKQIISAVSRNPSTYLALVRIMSPIRSKLISPLSVLFRDQRQTDGERYWAAVFLAEFAFDQPNQFTDLLLDANSKQFAVLWPKIIASDRHEVFRTKLREEVSSKAANAEKRANAAIALLILGDSQTIWPMLEHSTDCQLRTFLIHRLIPLGVDPAVVTSRLKTERNNSIRRALVLSLGEMEEASTISSQELIADLFDLYENSHDPGLHMAARWLLQRWKQQQRLEAMEEKWKKSDTAEQVEKINQYLTRRGASPSVLSSVNDAKWYVNSQGQTMVAIPGPLKFKIGTPATDPGRMASTQAQYEAVYDKEINRSFAISTTLVTVKEFREFRPNHEHVSDHNGELEAPMNMVTWYEAAEYCNWLSTKEKLECVYVPDNRGEYGPGMKTAEKYLQRTGYRLPTDAEWEYACQAGAVTTRFYGEATELLEKYGWYAKNSNDKVAPIALLKPNDFGLFDVYGNLYEWAGSRFVKNCGGADAEDDSDIKEIGTEVRSMRGGAFNSHAVYLRSAHRDRFEPATRLFFAGFRIARTLRVVEN